MGIDFNYFFYSSPLQEVRDKHEDLLIECYHKLLSETLIALDYERCKVPTLEDVKDDVKAYQMYGELNLKL